MDRNSRNFKLLSLVKNPTTALKDLTNNISEPFTRGIIENKTINLSEEKDQENHIDTKDVENEKCFVLEEEGLQSALAELREQVEITEQFFDTEGDDLSSSLINNVISDTEQIDTNFDSFIFYDGMLNATANAANNKDAQTEIVLDGRHGLEKENIRNVGNIIGEDEILKRSEEADNEVINITYQIMNDDNEAQNSDEEILRKRKKKRLSNPADWKYNSNKKREKRELSIWGEKITDMI